MRWNMIGLCVSRLLGSRKCRSMSYYLNVMLGSSTRIGDCSQTPSVWQRSRDRTLCQKLCCKTVDGASFMRMSIKSQLRN